MRPCSAPFPSRDANAEESDDDDEGPLPLVECDGTSPTNTNTSRCCYTAWCVARLAHATEDLSRARRHRAGLQFHRSHHVRGHDTLTRTTAQINAASMKMAKATDEYQAAWVAFADCRACTPSVRAKL